MLSSSKSLGLGKAAAMMRARCVRSHDKTGQSAVDGHDV